MRILVTGAAGFVGRWLLRELSDAGHEAIPAPPVEQLDVADAAPMAALVASLRPDAVVHLAAVSSPADATADPSTALRTAVGGTQSLFEGLRAAGLRSAVLVAGSSEVYGSPSPEDLPLREGSPARPASPYALVKLAQEGVAIEAGVRHGFPVVVTRAFNHAGPGQRPDFVVPALAGRVRAMRAGTLAEVPVGNLDVRRDFCDVRDVVRAYRLLLEAAAAGAAAGRSGHPSVVNVASGRSLAIREILERLCALAGVAPRIRVDPALVRAGEAPEIVGSFALLEALTGWAPTIPIARTLADVLAEDGPGGAPA